MGIVCIWDLYLGQVNGLVELDVEPSVRYDSEVVVVACSNSPGSLIHLVGDEEGEVGLCLVLGGSFSMLGLLHIFAVQLVELLVQDLTVVVHYYPEGLVPMSYHQ